MILLNKFRLFLYGFLFLDNCGLCLSFCYCFFDCYFSGIVWNILILLWFLFKRGVFPFFLFVIIIIVIIVMGNTYFIHVNSSIINLALTLCTFTLFKLIPLTPTHIFSKLFIFSSDLMSVNFRSYYARSTTLLLFLLYYCG